MPFAKKDFEGNVISSQKDLNVLYLDTFISTLIHRPILSKLNDLKKLQDKLCLKRVEAAKLNKSKPWKLENLLKDFSCLKNGKLRDPRGLVNELFQPGVAGINFQKSYFFNGK